MTYGGKFLIKIAGMYFSLSFKRFCFNKIQRVQSKFVINTAMDYCRKISSLHHFNIQMRSSEILFDEGKEYEHKILHSHNLLKFMPNNWRTTYILKTVIRFHKILNHAFKKCNTEVVIFLIYAQIISINFICFIYTFNFNVRSKEYIPNISSMSQFRW